MAKILYHVSFTVVLDTEVAGNGADCEELLEEAITALIDDEVRATGAELLKRGLRLHDALNFQVVRVASDNG